MIPHRFQFDWFDLPDKQRVLAEAMQFQFSQTEKFSPDQLAQLQLTSLQSLLRHCTRHVPYYRRNAYPQISSWKDWAGLPILTRSELQEHGAALRADIDLTSREGKTSAKRSSGSTGKPVEVLTTERAQMYWRAITMRDHLWQRRDFTQTLATIKNLGKDKTGPPGKKSRHWGPSTGLLYATGPSITISSSTDISKQYRWLSTTKPGYLLTYPSILRALAEQNLVSPHPIQLRDISTIGENLIPETRSFAERSFGTRVSDIYSCQEMGYLALQCPEHDHYHLQAETVLVEVLDENNRACAPGDMGRVVATHLHNYAMPLIRYEIGDYAIAGAPCDCGINLPVLQRIIGRTRNLVCYPNGDRSWPAYNVTRLIEVLPNVQFQLVQKSVDTLLLRIGTDKPVPETILQQLKGIINAAMGFPFNMQFEQLQHIPRSHSGKYEEFLSEV